MKSKEKMKKEKERKTGQERLLSCLSRCKKSICIFTAVLTATCILSACGPEPGPGQDTDALFGEEQPAEGAIGTGAQNSQNSPEAGSEPGGAGSGADAADGYTVPSAASGEGVPENAQDGISGQASGSAYSAGIRGTVEQVDGETLSELQQYLNEESSYGFLLSSYERPQEIDLDQVFYAGAGFEQKGLEKKERKLLQDRTPEKMITSPVIKVTEEDVDTLLKQKTGISHQEFLHPLGDLENWFHIGRYSAWYTLNADTNRRQILCSDAWKQGDLYIVHYQLADPVIRPPQKETTKASGKSDDGSAEGAAGKTTKGTSGKLTDGSFRKSTEGSAEKTTTGSTTGATEKASETSGEMAGETAVETVGKTAGETVGETAGETAGKTVGETAGGTTKKSAEAKGEAADPADPAGTADTSSDGDTAAQPVPETEENSAAGKEEDAFYKPFYEAQLKKTPDGWQFCSNILWVQKDLIEAQSYQAELDDSGEVFFAPFYPDKTVSENADVTFGLVRQYALLAELDPMEEGNIRTDLIFEGVDAVDFTDYNKDGCQDILTVCSYTRTGSDGKKQSGIREARVYTGREDGFPFLDLKKTEEVNEKVCTLDITDITQYLTGGSDGNTKKYNSWKEAFADRIRHTDKKEYDGFALIYLNDDRVPELVQAGATSAKGSTVVVYKNGVLQETWLNRRSFRYLEYENLLYSASGMENLHFDSFYSITRGQLGMSVQGFYGNKEFARIRYDEKGREIYDYFWDGAEVSRSGYSDGIMFVFDLSRAKTCGEGENILTAEEMLEKLK